MKLSADLIKSLVLHGAVLALLAVQFQGLTIKVKPSNAGNNQPILEAIAVKESEISSELKRHVSREQQAEKAKQQKLADIEKKAQETLHQQKQAEEKLRATQQQAVALQKQQKKAEAQAKTKLEAEKAALKVKEKEIAEQKVIQQKAAEEQKKTAQAELEKEKSKLAEEKVKLAEEKVKAAAENAKLAKAAEEDRQKALRQESERLLQQALEAEAAQSLAQDEIEQYYGVIVKKIQQNWRRDYGEQSSLSCRVQVHLLPSGEVTDVKVLQSSGNPQFDRQATLAVLRSSPLPLPASQTARQAFLSGFDFLFKPEG